MKKQWTKVLLYYRVERKKVQMIIKHGSQVQNNLIPISPGFDEYLCFVGGKSINRVWTLITHLWNVGFQINELTIGTFFLITICKVDVRTSTLLGCGKNI